MNDPVSVSRAGHRCFLKWHRARRRVSDPVFTGRRIVEGMRLGASVEVDLVIHGEHGFAVLHDHLSIARETTGEGAARDHTAAEMRSFHLRGNDGLPIDDRVMLLEDLCALLAREPPPDEALLQLDFKEGQGALAPETIAAFGRIVGPVAHNMILSSGEARAVRALAAAAPTIHIGYDPCHGEAIAQLRRTRDFGQFVRTALAEMPEAELIYLAYQAVLEGDANGVDVVGAFHAAGKRVDAYTLKAADAENAALAERLLVLGVDQITTDDAEGLAALLG